MKNFLHNQRHSIPTTYNGVEFASKLEADWARFLTNQSIKWDYEPAGCYVGETFVLCDFFLPELEQWLEVKGPWTEAEKIKYSRLAEKVGDERLIIGGPKGACCIGIVAPPPVGFCAWDDAQLALCCECEVPIRFHLYGREISCAKCGASKHQINSWFISQSPKLPALQWPVGDRHQWYSSPSSDWLEGT